MVTFRKVLTRSRIKLSKYTHMITSTSPKTQKVKGEKRAKEEGTWTT